MIQPTVLKALKAFFCIPAICMLAGAAWVHKSAYPSEVQREKFHIYLLMGQSNMSGRGVRQNPQMRSSAAGRILVMTESGSWLPLKEPLQHIGDQADKAGIGPGVAFALKLLELDSDITVGLVPLAVGGSSLASWEKDGKNYSRAIRYATVAAQQGVIKGMLWHQGETDAVDLALASNYGRRLGAVITSMRREINAPRLPFVMGELGVFLRKMSNGTSICCRSNINGALAEVASQVDRAGVVSSLGLTDRGDQIHFDARSADELGRRYASVLLEIAARP